MKENKRLMDYNSIQLDVGVLVFSELLVDLLPHCKATTSPFRDADLQNRKRRRNKVSMLGRMKNRTEVPLTSSSA